MRARIAAWRATARAALRIVFVREHLRRTGRIALVVGCILTAINQLDVIVAGEATAVTALKCGLNFCVPFVVSNLGLLAGRRGDIELAAAGDALAGEPRRGRADGRVAARRPG